DRAVESWTAKGSVGVARVDDAAGGHREVAQVWSRRAQRRLAVQARKAQAVLGIGHPGGRLLERRLQLVRRGARIRLQDVRGAGRGERRGLRGAEIVRRAAAKA